MDKKLMKSFGRFKRALMSSLDAALVGCLSILLVEVPGILSESPDYRRPVLGVAAGWGVLMLGIWLLILLPIHFCVPPNSKLWHRRFSMACGAVGAIIFTFVLQLVAGGVHLEVKLLLGYLIMGFTGAVMGVFGSLTNSRFLIRESRWSAPCDILL